jgi:predicted Zn-dependent peptidase
MNILGNEQTIRSFKKKHFRAFFKDHADSRKFVFSCVGNISLLQVEEVAKKYLENKPVFKSTIKRKKLTPISNARLYSSAGSSKRVARLAGMHIHC